MRHYENTDSKPEATTRLELTIEVELEDFNDKNQRWLQYALAAFLEIAPNAVRVAAIERGSVRVAVELPTSSAERLLSAHKRGDAELAKYLAPLVLLDVHRKATRPPRIRQGNMAVVHAEVEKPAKDRAGKRRISFGILSKHGRQIVAAAGVLVAFTSCAAAVIVVPEVRRMLGLESSATPSVPTMAGQIATPTATSTLTRSPTATWAPTPSPTPYLVVSVERLSVYAGPGEVYDVWGEVRRGDQLLLRGCSKDGMWWQVDYLGRKGWIRAQPVGANVEPTVLRTAEAPPTPITTPTPTQTATPTLLAPNTMLPLQNPRFERVQENVIPGWRWWAADNYPDEEYDPQESFDTPFFSQTSDPARVINGATLQIEATAFVNCRVHVFQIVSVLPSVTVRFQAAAKAFSNVGGIKLAAGIDPDGGPDCSQARWGDELTIDQSSGTVQLVAPIVVVGRDGQVTVCLRAENILPARSNAAYFDDAALIANPE